MGGEHHDDVGPRHEIRVELDPLHRGPVHADLGDVRVVEADLRPAPAQLRDDLDGGRLADVAHVRLVGDAEDEHERVTGAAALVVQALDHPVHDVAAHAVVDLPGKLDEAGGLAHLPNPPRQVRRVDRDAVAPPPRSRVERLEPEGLGGGGVDHLPHVDAEVVAEHRHLVGEGDVDVPVGVLDELGHLGRPRRRDRDDALHERAVERRHELRARRVDAPDDLGHVAEPEALVAGVDALRREPEEEVLPCAQARSLEDVAEELLRRPRVGRALEDHELPRPEAAGEGRGRRFEMGEVGQLLAQRRRDAHDHDVGLQRSRLIRGRRGAEAAVAHERTEIVAAHEPGHALGVDVEPGDREARIRCAEHEREAHVAEPDDRDGRRPALDPGPQIGRQPPGFGAPGPGLLDRCLHRGRHALLPAARAASFPISWMRRIVPPTRSASASVIADHSGIVSTRAAASSVTGRRRPVPRKR
jgi:hypothetical protein